MAFATRCLNKVATIAIFSITTVCISAMTDAEPASAIKESALVTDCDKALHFFWKGKLAGNQERSMAFYRKAIALCPGFIRPYELAGNIYRNQGRSDDAIAYFKKAAELGTVNSKLYFLLAMLLFEKGDMDEASWLIDKSLDIRPDYPEAIKLKEKIEKAIDRDGPKILLFEPVTTRSLMVVRTYKNITVRGLVTDKSGVAWIEVNKNRISPDKYGNFLKDISVQIGDNTIIVEAADARGNPSRLSVKVRGEAYKLPKLKRVESLAQAKKLYGSSHAVVIGIDRYKSWPSLEYGVADAKAVRAVLERSGFDEITMILDQEATQRRILTELFESLPKRVDRNDRVLFYFAGHGQTEELRGGGNRGYIIPVDAEPGHYSASAISMDQIRSLSRRIPAKHILYVMDSCYSGLGLNRSTGISPQYDDYLRKISSMRVVQIITAGGKAEQVQERLGHGLFTGYFLKALDGEADINHDGVVTGTELGAYLRPAVSNASYQAQTPLFGRLEGEGEFLFFVEL